MMEDYGLLLIQPKRPAILIIHYPEATNYRSLASLTPDVIIPIIFNWTWALPGDCNV